MSSKIFLSIVVAGLLASFALFVLDAEAESLGSTKMTFASSLGLKDQRISPQDECYFCGDYASSQCCYSAAAGGRKDKSTVGLVKPADISKTAGGDKVNPQATCNYCGYIEAGICLNCRGLDADAAAEGFQPKN
ncbi:hypothetical protein SAY87_021225 [Trapa incisa]|uniref:Uncharacterized protein n=1 Tax=Trapa incisa TaxID=236973 RepID=A0AAN7JWU3_9MYRT|nr:hypothetical protein SAY87_021221 [Trapa incisa]KAK4752427.1 hypothetical protein SAY87_021225 [Trapa incisa]